MNGNLCRHWVVSGRVQGVWFRAATKEQAMQLGLTGWVCNLQDGRVEVLACGAKEKVEQLHAWLQRGPDRAEVKEVIYEEVPWQEHGQFLVT